MNLSSEIISQFVKVTKDDKKPNSETTHYGTVVENEGVNYVRLDGSELLTPVVTTARIYPGERVTVMLKNHTAIVTGNITSPSARTADVEHLNKVAADIDKRVSEFEHISGNVASKDELDAEKVKIEALQKDVKALKELPNVTFQILSQWTTQTEEDV